jgi:hypothetical protein
MTPEELTSAARSLAHGLGISRSSFGMAGSTNRGLVSSSCRRRTTAQLPQSTKISFLKRTRGNNIEPDKPSPGASSQPTRLTSLALKGC